MVDYRKWDHIEVSDDEDDIHPNIDTPSLFRWRHQARVERMEKDKKEKEEFEGGYTNYQRKMNEMRKKIREAEQMDEMTGDLQKMKMEFAELEKHEKEWKEKEEELKKKERLAPQNIDTLCKEGKSKTIINKVEKPKELTEDEKLDKQVEMQKKHEKDMKKYGMLRKYEDSQTFLVENPHLVCEETANYLVVWCINLEMEQKHDLMNHVAHQTIVMQFILELGRQTEVDPRGCIRPFFSRIKLAEQTYLDAFNDELNSFKERIRKRAKEKLDKAMKELEEEEREKRLGPGGLDPVEVMDSLPEVLQKCFESKDIQQLQDALLAMPKEEAELHLKRCIDSGLWVPNAREADEAASGEGGQQESEEGRGQ
ncbi:unnamed protein product [Owenia fusiformis]|uniref:Hsp90 chaperone protein kinase-targeting subunit n=1 Tax=Owenia fusiformis TaxID=6347 RepID=A0A8J1TBC6_OWEFU|nr:unnamed protein product [Owenia fusiformis]